MNFKKIAVVAALSASTLLPAAGALAYTPNPVGPCLKGAPNAYLTALQSGYCGTTIVLNNTSAGTRWQWWSSGLICRWKWLGC
jgi:hypothetical protein